MESVQKRNNFIKAKRMFDFGLQCTINERHMYTKKNINMAEKIMKDKIKDDCDAKIAELELQIKQLRLHKKDMFMKITHHKKKLLQHFGHNVK